MILLTLSSCSQIKEDGTNEAVTLESSNINLQETIDNVNKDELTNGTFEKDYNQKILIQLANGNTKEIEFNELDLEPMYDDVAAVTVDFDKENFLDGIENLVRIDDENIYFQSGGIYVLTGHLINKRIRVEKNIGENILFVFKDLNITSNKSNVLYVDNDCKVVIFNDLNANNSISINVDNAFVKDETLTSSAAIYTLGNLSLVGTGSLSIKDNLNDGIECKNTLSMIAGNIEIDVKKDGLKAKNAVLFKNANVNIKSGDDAVKATSNKNGLIYVEDGTVNITSTDKGFSSDNEVIMIGGDISIDSIGESITAKTIDLLGGNINLKSGDDAINSTDKDQNKKSAQVGVYTNVAGGKLNIDATMDAIDSNGDLYFENCKVYINGSTNDNERIIDYNKDIRLGNNVEFIAVGPSTKMQDFGDSSSQNYIAIYMNEAVDEGSTINIVDSNNENILTWVSQKSFKGAFLTSEKLIEGKDYKIKIGDFEKDIKLVSGRNSLILN